MKASLIHRGRASGESRSLDELTELLTAGSLRARLLSLDIFDTVLTRTCGEPSDLFLWLGRRLRRHGIVNCDPEVFARVRASAEQAVWRREGGLDSRASLEQFYAEVVHRLGLGSSLINTLVDAELELEAEVSRSVPAAQRLLKHTVDDGRSVVFTSDTYLSTTFVEAMLRAAGLLSSNTRCLVSSEMAESKASGRLFRRLIPPDQRPADVLHVGDHPHSDVAMPGKLGVRAQWVSEARLNRYEKCLSASSFATAGLGSAFAGASRLARLSTSVETGHDRAIRDVAAGVAAPTLVGYVLWVLHRAQQLSLPRLVFLARDGQVLADIARRLVKRLDLSIEITYLFVSRRSTNLAATFEASEEETGWVFRDLKLLSPEELLDRFDLRQDDVTDQLAEVGSGPISTSAVELGRVLRQQLDNGPLRQLVLDNAEVRREHVVAYLRQEGLLDGSPCGLVDFGGVGSQVRALHAVMSDVGVTPPRIFMMGLDRPEDAGLVTPDVEPEWVRDTECYLYDHRRGRGVRRARGFGTCVQMFCAADHGTVLGYRVRDSRVDPVLSVERDDETLRWGLPMLRTTIANFVDSLVMSDDLVDLYADVREVSCDLVNLFWTQPGPDEAAAWGKFPFEGAQASGSAPKPLVYRYTWRTIGGEIAGGHFPNLGWQHWYEGSLVVSSPVVRTAVRRAEALYRRLEQYSGVPGAPTAVGAFRRLAGR